MIQRLSCHASIADIATHASIADIATHAGTAAVTVTVEIKPCQYH